MKVINRGIPSSERLWRGTCCNCKSEVEAKERELKHITYDQRDGSFSWEVCPVCRAGNITGYGGICFHPAKD
jgi:hypothetical protein